MGKQSQNLQDQAHVSRTNMKKVSNENMMLCKSFRLACPQKTWRQEQDTCNPNAQSLPGQVYGNKGGNYLCSQGRGSAIIVIRIQLHDVCAGDLCFPEHVDHVK